MATGIASDVQTTEPAPVEKQISTPEPPKQSLASLLAEVDAIMDPPARVNANPARGNHYSDPGVKSKTNPDSELMAYWNLKRYEKSDAEMARIKA